jgi:hypothetical protein
VQNSYSYNLWFVGREEHKKDKYGKGNKKVCKIVERHTGHQFLHGPETSPKGLQNIAK